MANRNSDLLYGLDDKPPIPAAILAALQHMLASFVGIITPTLIIGGVLGLGAEIPYLISMALIVSGVGTFIQAKKIGPIGSGMVALQGTSFAFLGSILAAGFIAKAKGGGPEEILSLIFGVCYGLFEVILNVQATSLEKKLKIPMMSGFHAFWSIGLLSGSLLTSLFLEFKISFFINSLVYIIFLAPLIFFSSLTIENNKSDPLSFFSIFL